MRFFELFILRHLRSEPARLAATLVGFALGIAVILAIRMANSSSVRGFEAALETISGKTSLEIVGAGEGLDERQLLRLGWLEELGDVSPVVEGDAWFRGQQGGEAVRILGVDILRDRPFREYSLLEFQSGRQPDVREFLELLADPYSIILTSRFAREHGIEVGRQIEFVIGDRPHRFTVRALLGATGPARAYNGSFALMDIAGAQWAFGGSLGRLSRIEVRLHDPGLVDEVERSVAARLPAGLSVQRPARRGRQAEKMLEAFHFNLTALSYISLLVGLFMIYNTVSVSVISRRGEIGTLRAIGAGRGLILGLFLGEALLLATAGCLVGLFLARYLARGAVALTATTVGVIYRSVVSAPPPLGVTDWILAFAVGLPLGLLAAALPALEAARVMPTDAIRGADRLETRRRLRPRHFLVPALLLLAGWWLSTFRPVGGLPLYGFAAALLIVCGGAALTSPALYGMGKAGRRPLACLLGVEGMLAHANLSGSIPRLAVSVAALALSLSMMVAIAVMVGSFRETVIYWIGQTLRGDLYVSPAARTGFGGRAVLSPAVAKAVASIPAVDAVDPFRRLELPYGEGTITAAGDDFATLLSRRNLLFKAPDDPWPAVKAAIGSDAVLASESFCIKHSRSVGDTIELALPEGRHRFRINAVYFDYSSDRGIVVMDSSTFERHFGDMGPSSLTVYLKGGSDAEQVRANILKRLGGGFRVFVNTNDGIRREILRVFDSTFRVTYALEVIAIFVAILGVSSTLVSLILERRRDLAMLRLVGADTGQVTRMIVVEAVMLGVASQAIGLAVGLGLSLLLIYVINVQSFGWTIQFHLPVGFLVQMSVAIMAATALAGIYPARRACRLAPAQQVVEE